MFGKDLKLSIREAMLSKGIILGKVIKLIHKMLIFRESVKVTINKV